MQRTVAGGTPSVTVERLRVDAVVVGAGSAGAAAAYFLGREGLSVALLEERRLAHAGARWVNAIPPWMFSRAGLERPEEPECVAAEPPFALLDADGRPVVRFARSPLLQVDMRLLVARLQRLARGASVRAFERVRNVRLVFERGRPARVTAAIRGARGETELSIEARLFVDASGMRGVLRGQHQGLARACPTPDVGDCCDAAQAVCEVADVSGARAFLERSGLEPGASFSWIGVRGGYSTLGALVSADFRRVGVLAGVMAGGRHGNGEALLGRFRAANPWIGHRVFGGRGRIPLGPPYRRFGAPGLVLVGDAAGQVFAGHASGVGLGLVAARLLADAAVRTPELSSIELARCYERAFHLAYGPLVTFYDTIRRVSEGLTDEEARMFPASGLVVGSTLHAALAQQLVAPALREVPSLLGGLVRHPRLGAGLVVRSALVTAARLRRRFA